MLNIQWFAAFAIASSLTLLPDVASAAAPTMFKALDPALGQLPESITTDDDGNIYLSVGTTVGKITPGGIYTTFASLPVPAGSFTTGLKFDEHGYLYAGTAGFGPDPAVAFIWRISPSGNSVSEYAELDPHGFPNDLAFDDDGDLYVTDPFLGLIWKIDGCGGDPEIWLADELLEPDLDDPYLVISPFGVDGIAFDKHQKHLYVGNLDYGRILKIEVDKHGDAGDIDVFHESAAIKGVDGIAFDKKENLYLAVHGQDRVTVLDKKAKATHLHTGAPLQQPSSLVFGATNASKKTLYIANFSILAALGVKPGPPTPGLLKLTVPNEGLDLPNL